MMLFCSKHLEHDIKNIQMEHNGKKKTNKQMTYFKSLATFLTLLLLCSKK